MTDQAEDLTHDERKAIASLKRVAKNWPKSLWLFAGGQQGIAVMKKNSRGERASLKQHSGMDPAFQVDQVNIESDGGDW